MSVVIDALLNRNSAVKLAEPAPSAEQLERIIQCALRAPDHAALRPWRFICITGEKRKDLGDILVAAKEAEMLDKGEVMSLEQAEKLALKPQRAPMIIVPVLCVKDHPKVPEVEQVLSMGAACENLLLALEAFGFAGIWRTGLLAFSDEVHQGLALASHEKALGFIYIGSRDAKAKALPEHDVADFLSHW